MDVRCCSHNENVFDDYKEKKMNTKNRIFFTSLTLLLSVSLLLTACSLPAPEPPTQDVSAIHTVVAATMMAQIQPSATTEQVEQPTLTPTATGGCEDRMNMTAWERDNVIYDVKAVKAPLSPNTPFTLSWTFQNTGACTWDDGYSLTYESGTEMTQSQHYPIVPPGQKIAPGDIMTVNVVMTTPAKLGEYQAIWRLQSKAGNVLGSFDVKIRVANLSALIPAHPENLTYTFECTVDGSAITFTWTDAASNEDGYRVYRDGSQIKELSAGVTAYTDNVPRIAGYYTYTIVAFNTVGESKAATMAAKNVEAVCPP
jgi:hypothetical protein